MTDTQKQCLLVFLGYDTGGIGNGWGPKSKNAVECAQEDLGLPETGAWDEVTESRVLKAVYTWDDETAGTGSGDEDFWEEIEYFTITEPGISCPCGRCGGFPVKPVERLMRNADATRKHFGRPMIPSSTVRCAAHNAELPGSAPNSLHMRGKAMDFAIPGVSANTILNYIRTLPEVDEAYAIDGSYVHMGVQEYV